MIGAAALAARLDASPCAMAKWSPWTPSRSIFRLAAWSG